MTERAKAMLVIAGGVALLAFQNCMFYLSEEDTIRDGLKCRQLRGEMQPYYRLCLTSDGRIIPLHGDSMIARTPSKH